MNEEQIIKFCIEHKISVEQYFFMWMVLNKAEWMKPYDESLVKQYLKEAAVFAPDAIRKLVDRGLVIDMNSQGMDEVNFYMIDDDVAATMVMDDDMAQQLWDKYPAEFPLGGGGSFIARGGAPKEDILFDYRRRIKNSPRRHVFVMQQLDRYIRLVQGGRINGRKLVDFVREEIWDVVADIPRSEDGGTFFKDI